MRKTALARRRFKRCECCHTAAISRNPGGISNATLASDNAERYGFYLSSLFLPLYFSFSRNTKCTCRQKVATDAGTMCAVTVKMAATNSSLSSEIPAKKEDEFNEFYTEVRTIR